MTHPLNDKICRELTAHMDFYNPTVQRNDMRTAADWQLEQCLEFLRTHEFHKRRDYFDLRADNYANLLEDAMRPTQENNK